MIVWGVKEFITPVWEALPHIILGIDRHEIEESVSKGWLEFRDILAKLVE